MKRTLHFILRYKATEQESDMVRFICLRMAFRAFSSSFIQPGFIKYCPRYRRVADKRHSV